MKCLLIVLGMMVTTNLFAHADVALLDPIRKLILLYSRPPVVSSGHVLFAEVQDNGQSCVYTFKSMTVLSVDGKISMDSIKRRIDAGTTVKLVTAQSVDIDDVIDTLQGQFDNSGKYGELFAVTPEVLSGEYALYQGSISFFYTNPIFVIRRGVGRGVGSDSLPYLLQASQRTHSQEAVSCAEQPQI